MQKESTLILGASTNPKRYAYLAGNLLLKKGYKIALVGIKVGKLGDISIETDKNKILVDIDTITIYVGTKN